MKMKAKVAYFFCILCPCECVLIHLAGGGGKGGRESGRVRMHMYACEYN